VGPRAALNTMSKIKLLSPPLLGIEPRSNSPQPSNHTDDYTLLTVTTADLQLRNFEYRNILPTDLNIKYVNMI